MVYLVFTLRSWAANTLSDRPVPGGTKPSPDPVLIYDQ